jgi:2-oxoisovalerate dehydrogenase E1 component
MDPKQLLAWYRVMVTARQIDKLELELNKRGEAFFHVSGAGHEGTAVLASLLQADDWLLCHYRDKALMLARGVTPRTFFDGLFCKQASPTRGRQMCAHAFADRQLRILSAPVPVGNAALHTVGVATAIKHQSSRPLVLHSIGEGGTQEGEFLEACAEAVRLQLPLLFLVQDNQLAISTRTRGQTFYSYPDGEADTFYGMPIYRVDGRHVVSAWREMRPVLARIRETRAPAVVVLDVDRLSSHTNADDETIYRDAAEIRRVSETGDPIRNLERYLCAAGHAAETLDQIRRDVAAEVAEAEAAAYAGAEPAALPTAKLPVQVELTHPSRERHGVASGPGLTMREALRDVLRCQMRKDPGVYLLGQDIEDPKGDVFGVTRGLSTEFPDRVRNAPLAESTIIGSCIGQALTGRRPVAFLQFSDFLPLAYNQLANELGSLYWRTDGLFQAPVIVMVACGGYRPGMGPFHAGSHESVAAHIPGIDVFMPSTAGDAAVFLIG